MLEFGAKLCRKDLIDIDVRVVRHIFIRQRTKNRLRKYSYYCYDAVLFMKN